MRPLQGLCRDGKHQQHQQAAAPPWPLMVSEDWPFISSVEIKRKANINVGMPMPMSPDKESTLYPGYRYGMPSEDVRNKTLFSICSKRVWHDRVVASN
jgi:hypothetical protein